MFKWIKKDAIHYLILEEFHEYGVRAYFTSRKGGGVSQNEYSSLNMGLHTLDNNDNVLTNRKYFSEALNIDHDNLTAGEQIHGNRVHVVSKEDKGSGALDYENSVKGVDALITDIKGLPLISFYADCVPLFFLDPVHKIGGVAHAGWKGTVKKIAIKTLNKMSDYFGSTPDDCIVGIGPSISRKNYEVDNYVVDKFKKEFAFYKEVIDKNKDGTYQLDLPLSNYKILKKAGVKENNIINSSICTFDKKEYFYSYRRDNGKTGRMASIFVL